jgi:LysM repeat protein
MILDNFFEPRKKSIVEATMSPGSPALAVPKAPAAPATPALAAPKTPAAPAPQSNRQYSKTYNAQTKQWTTNAPAANPMAQDPAQRAQNLQQAQQATPPDQDTDFDSYEQSGNTAVPMTKGGVGQNLYKMPVSQVPQGFNITQKYNNYQQQGDSAVPVAANGGVDQLAKIPVSQVPKGANITQTPTPGGNLYKNLPGAGTLEEQDQPLDKELVNQIYRNNKDVIGANPDLIEPKTMIDLPDGTPYEVQPGDTLSKIARKMPAIKAAAAASNAAVTPEPSFMDKLKQAASGLAAGQFPSQAIPAAFPSLKKPAPAAVPAPSAALPGPVANQRVAAELPGRLPPEIRASLAKRFFSLRPGLSDEQIDDLERTGQLPPLASGHVFPDPRNDARFTPRESEAIRKLATSKAAPTVKAAPEKVSPADSLDPGEQFVAAKKLSSKPTVARPAFPHTPTPKTGIAAAMDKAGRAAEKVASDAVRLEKGAEKAVKQGIEWIGDKIATRAETPGSKSPYTQKNILGSSAYGRYQFMPDTFKGLVALANPGDPLYGKTWKDFKKDPKVQDETMKVADNYYTDVLSRNKIPTTDGNKYLSHFVGAENAVGVLNLPTKTPLKDLYRDVKLKNGETIPNSFFTKNNFSTDMTVGDLRKWADAKIAPPAKKKTKESTVAETVHTVKVMLETATTRDDVRQIKDYIDRQYTRHGLTDSVSFAQRNHLVERVIEITVKRRILT